jgi:hypothetical protein
MVLALAGLILFALGVRDAIRDIRNFFHSGSHNGRHTPD